MLLRFFQTDYLQVVFLDFWNSLESNYTVTNYTCRLTAFLSNTTEED